MLAELKEVREETDVNPFIFSLLIAACVAVAIYHYLSEISEKIKGTR